MSYKHFTNTACDFYPCHPDVENQNCLFCFCPLYGKDECSGTYSRTQHGIRDCSNCTFPHKPENYELVIQKLFPTP